MDTIDVQKKMERNPMYLDAKRPETWGEEVSTPDSEWADGELPVQITVLVRDNELWGLRGPYRVLEALAEHYLHSVDIDGLFTESCLCARDDEEDSGAEPGSE